jgi:Inositol hexakisphosphate
MSTRGGSAARAAGEAVHVEVNVHNPLQRPYRTGSYLISDEGGTDHFRSAWDPKLGAHRYRASGSHQLDADEFARVLGGNVVEPHRPSRIYLVDLREETHGFFDGRAVSWYADNDFANVGQPLSWIERDEDERLRALVGQTTQVFALDTKAPAPDNRHQQRVTPVSYTEVRVGGAYPEAMVAEMLATKFRLPVIYRRIPVTDHCAPSDAALGELLQLWAQVGKDNRSWVHFHCHGGDGRTTTFLALYDMLWWKKSKDPLPPLQVFACRQCELFHYCLNPDACDCGTCKGQPPSTGWRRSLAKVRWVVLEEFRQRTVVARP